MEPVNLLEYEPLAREKLSQSAYGLIAGAAEDELTLREGDFVQKPSVQVMAMPKP